jgi:PhnB protein
MLAIHPHINFNGNCEEAFNFYQSVFGGGFARVIRFKEMTTEEFPVAAQEENKIMYIALPVGRNNLLIGNDVPEMLGTVNERENRSKITAVPESREEADRIFNALSAGGEVEMPIGEAPWGGYFGMFRDKYGIEWIVDYTC